MIGKIGKVQCGMCGGPGTVIVVKSGDNAFRRGVQADLYGIQHN